MNKLPLHFALHVRAQSQSHCDYGNHMPPSAMTRKNGKKDDAHQNYTNHTFQLKNERKTERHIFEMLSDTLDRLNL